MVLQYQLDEARGFVQRRVHGDYEVDTFGLDRELVELVQPFAGFLYHTWWRVTSEGLEHVPADGRALLVANHAGLLPWDGAMIATAIFEEHHTPRMARVLHDRWMDSAPLLAPLLTALGQTPATPENARLLLESDQLACVFPEGTVGAGKPFSQRYRLADFGRGEYIQAAIRTGAPIIPVAVVGVEEAYPNLFNIAPLARLFRLPFFPVTPLFPWFGPFGAIALPSKWSIVFHPSIETTAYGPARAEDLTLVTRLNDQVRDTIQETLDQRVRARRSLFLGS
jgi:1-acyl-sn-glycerol-3-phosphate acyltransferase